MHKYFIHILTTVQFLQAGDPSSPHTIPKKPPEMREGFGKELHYVQLSREDAKTVFVLLMNFCCIDKESKIDA